MDPGITALGTWSGGRFMHFGEPLEEERLAALLRPDAAIATVITADVYGAGDADRLLGRALAGVAARRGLRRRRRRPRFLRGRPRRRQGLPALHRPVAARPDAHAGYLRMATERSLERCGIDRFDVLLLHNPDRTGYGSEPSGTGWRRCATPA